MSTLVTTAVTVATDDVNELVTMAGALGLVMRMMPGCSLVDLLASVFSKGACCCCVTTLLGGALSRMLFLVVAAVPAGVAVLAATNWKVELAARSLVALTVLETPPGTNPVVWTPESRR